jgi:phosphoribosylanthranilate isomerase
VTLVKICGVTRAGDAEAAVQAGADLIGLIFAESERGVDVAQARRLLPAAAGARVVGVFTDPRQAAIVEEELGLDFVQIYGPHAGLRNPIVATRAEPPQDVDDDIPLLLDLPRGSRPGAEELRAHWARARALHRRVVLAGSLDAGNVGAAVEAARPWAVDTARGVESAPGIKDLELVRRFVRAAKEAADER